jgi:uncharacterized membrane protein YcgQ (UPF0703/DUF1980 family)
MKTTKLVLIAALVSFALMSFANTQFGESSNVITLKYALTKSPIVNALYTQIHPAEFLKNEQSGIYTAHVRVKEVIYYVTASYKEWIDFFYEDPTMSSLCRGNKTNTFGTSNPLGNAGISINPFGKTNPFGHKGKKTKGPGN